MHKERKGKNFVKNPFYEGGLKAMRAFIFQNKKYPNDALEHKIEGTVFLKYTIDYKGNVIETKVVKSLGYGCDEEASRVVELLKFQVPKNRGVKVKFFKNIQIHFRLPEGKKETELEQQVSYTVTATTKKENIDTGKKKGKGYTIQIKY